MPGLNRRVLNALSVNPRTVIRQRHRSWSRILTELEQAQRPLFSHGTGGNDVRSPEYSLYFTQLFSSKDLKDLVRNGKTQAHPLGEFGYGHLAIHEKRLERYFFQECSIDPGLTN